MKNDKRFYQVMAAMALLLLVTAPCYADYGFEPSKASGYGFSDGQGTSGHGFPAAQKVETGDATVVLASRASTPGYGNYYYYWNPEYQQYYFKNYNAQGMANTNVQPKSILDPGYANQQRSIFSPSYVNQQQSICPPMNIYWQGTR
ncbi:MAG: hypothetical protein RDV48_26370 [Candidatus Eremiobacteraeota bacterium]|nr:hypothetical protein [Candidatus Eremiobacteraeota bacterium]